MHLLQALGVRSPLCQFVCVLQLTVTAGVVAAGEPARVPVRNVALSADGKQLAACVGDVGAPGSVMVWDVETRAQRWVHRAATSLSRVQFSPDGNSLAVGSVDNDVFLMNAADGKLKNTLAGNGKGIRSLAFSPDGKTLAVASDERAVRLWDLQTGAIKRTFDDKKTRFFAIAFSPDGKLLGATESTGWCAWEVDSGKLYRTFVGSALATQGIAFTADADQVLTGDNEGLIRLWSLSSGKELLALKNPGGILAMTFDPQRGLLATCPPGQRIPLIDIPNRKPTAAEDKRIAELLIKLDDDAYEVREKAGNDLLEIGLVAQAALGNAAETSPSAEVRIRCRRLRSEILSRTRTFLNGHTDSLSCVACCPATGLLASGSKDGTVRLWKMDQGKEIVCLVPAVGGK